MSSSSPPIEALASIMGPATRVTRRCDIYEEDGITPFMLDADIESGSVSVDASRNERRTFDISLNNIDGSLDNYPDKFWYDKVIKLYRGIEYDSLSKSYLSLTTADNSYAYTLDKSILDITSDIELIAKATMDWTHPDLDRILVAKWNEPTSQRSYQFGVYGTAAFGLTGYLHFGGSTNGVDNFQGVSSSALPFADITTLWVKVTVDVNDGSGNYVVKFWYSSQETDDVELVTWTQLGTTQTTAGTKSIFNSSTRLEVGSLNLSLDHNWNGKVHQVIVKNGIDGIVVAHPRFDQQANLIASFVDDLANSWLISSPATIQGGIAEIASWEVQLGEFLIDTIETQHFPHTTQVAGRDYTKKLLEDEFAEATSFASGTLIEEIIRTIALNGNIDKMILPSTGRSIRVEHMFEAGTSRWEAIKEIVTSFGYEVFFDNNGYLVMREFHDPVLSPTVFTFETGEFGTLASYKKRSSGQRIYNHVVVTGQASDQLPVVGIAENNNPESPTSIPRLKARRTYRYTSSFIPDEETAQEVAESFLAIKGLESFELSLDSIVFPWIDVAEIVEFIDPDPNPGDPTRFLLTDLNIPLGLGTMNSTAKRVTIVG